METTAQADLLTTALDYAEELTRLRAALARIEGMATAAVPHTTDCLTLTILWLITEEARSALAGEE